VVSLHYSEDEDAWYFTIGEVSGTRTGEVWRSTSDAATWTKVATFAASCLYGIVSFGSLLVGVALTEDTLEAVYSADSGATWKRTGQGVEGTVRGIYKGAGRPVIVTNTHTYFGVSTGADIGAVT
jgi:hypothetical protein